MCRPTCNTGSSRGEETGTIHPSVILPAPHTTKTAGRCRLSLDHWKKIAGPWHIKVLTHGIPRLDQRSTSVHKTFRFSKKLDWQAHRSGSLQKDPPTLSRHRINPSTPGPIRHKGSVVSLLPSSEEGHRQDEGVHRSQHHQPVPPVRALQDGRPSHHSGSASQEGSHVEDSHVRLLHASVDRGGGARVLPVSV